jgi:hypothetical protein
MVHGAFGAELFGEVVDFDHGITRGGIRNSCVKRCRIEKLFGKMSNSERIGEKGNFVGSIGLASSGAGCFHSWTWPPLTFLSAAA